MASGPYDTLLRSGALNKYQNQDLTKRDILNVVHHFPELRPMMEGFVHPDGRQQQLLCLNGTIPVTYKGSQYNIPIRIWLLESHPYNPPIVEVRPTPSMQIKPSSKVDHNGRVYLPYIHEWKHPYSDILGLLQILQLIFGEEPPVFSKAGPARPAPQPPQPTNNPPYPTGPSGMPSPYSYTPPANPGGYPYNQPPRQPYPGPPATNPYSPPTVGGYDMQRGYSALSDDQIKASLLSAVEDKIRRKLRDNFSQAQAELDALKKTNEDLQRGRTRLDDMLQRLEKEQSQVEKNIQLLNDKNKDIEDTLRRMQNREEVAIDDVIVPAAPVYKQILQAFAEEQATEDAIYYMGEALRKEVIDLDVFLKKVRELSRRQFLQRALIRKCRERAGLQEI